MQKRTYKFFILTIGLLLIGTGCAKPVLVEGTAMKPTLNNGDRIFLNTNPGELKRGDIVSFLYPKDTSKWYVKRIIGLPDETLEIRSGKVFINNELLDETYILNDLNKNEFNSAPKQIGKNQYFVMGDNRDNSSDSRYWGTVSNDLIVGKYSMTYYSSK